MIINASSHQIPLADGSVHAVVTSPPYFGLRKYEGAQDVQWPAGSYAPMTGCPPCVEVPAMACPFGNEPTIEAYVWHSLLILRECRRVLRDDGVLWLNLGDSYSSSAQRVSSCGIDDKAPANYQESDSSLKSPCDASQVSSSRRKPRKRDRRDPKQSASPSCPIHGHRESQTVHPPTSDSSVQGGHIEAASSRPERSVAREAERLRVARLSNAAVSSPSSPMSREHQSSTDCPSLQDSSFGDAQQCVCKLDDPSFVHFGQAGNHQIAERESDIDDSVLIGDALDSGISDTASDSYSYQYSTTEPHQSVELSAGNLLGIPHRVMLAAQADGWTVRNDCVWAKVAPMPESVKGWRFDADGNLTRGSWRHTRAHELIFQMTKGMGYYSDGEGVREKAEWNRWGAQTIKKDFRGIDPVDMGSLEERRASGRNPRSVLTPPPSAYSGAHFAVFPPELIRPLILSSVPRRCCPKCGAGWAAVTRSTAFPRTGERRVDGMKCQLGRVPGSNTRGCPDPQTTVHGSRPTCDCNESSHVPGIVLDPFCGSGTTGEVARESLVRFIGLDISLPYLRDQASWRAERKVSAAKVEEMPLFAMTETAVAANW